MCQESDAKGEQGEAAEWTAAAGVGSRRRATEESSWLGSRGCQRPNGEEGEEAGRGKSCYQHGCGMGAAAEEAIEGNWRDGEGGDGVGCGRA